MGKVVNIKYSRVMDSFQFSLFLPEMLLSKIETSDSVDMNLKKCRLSFGDAAELPGDENQTGKLRISRICSSLPQGPIFIKDESNVSKAGLKRSQPTVPPVKTSFKRQAPVAADQVAPKSASIASAPKTQMFAECIIDGERMFVCVKCAYTTKVNSNIHKHYR